MAATSPLVDKNVDKNYEDEAIQPLPSYQSVLVAADASDHSNRGVQEAVAIGSLWNASITGAHVYAAKLHDKRFRQMEGGLPEQYQEETELEKQRDIHDALITKGLSIITDSYLDQVELSCKEQGLAYRDCSLEGKNYRELVRETNSGQYDLLVIGALGLGAVQNSKIGTVCERVVRRTEIDTLVIKDPQRAISTGPIVVAVDGSTRSYGGLLTGLALAQLHNVPLHVISAFDPYYHYVAFNRIAKVLSEEAGKVFRFKEQEKLHEDIIDAGLAKIYQGHLEVSKDIASDYDIPISTKLLDGKPYEVIEKYLKEVNASLLIMGKLGIHADDDLDIGGNAENLLRNVPCSALISQREYQPSVDVLAEATTSWTTQAEERMLNVPTFARSMARLGILRYAQEQGHTVITEKIVDEATKNLCPVTIGDDDSTTSMDNNVGENNLTVVAKNQGEKKFNPDWSPEAEKIANSITDESVRNNLKMRAEKKARQANSDLVEEKHILALIDTGPSEDSQATNNQNSQSQSTTNQSTANKSAGKSKKKCPMGFSENKNPVEASLPWSDTALERLNRVPAGFMRDLTRKRVETFARKKNHLEVTPELMSEKYQEWGEGSSKQQKTLDWSAKALEKIARIPDFVQGMIIKEVERCAAEQGITEVTLDIISNAGSTWAKNESFHSEGNPDQYKE